MKKPNGRDWILLILAVGIGVVGMWTFSVLIKPVQNEIDYSPYLKQREELLDSIAKLQVKFDKEISDLKKQYEKIDTLTVDGVDADVVNFKLRATHRPRFR